MNKKENSSKESSIKQLLAFATSCKNLLISAVILAVLGAAAGVVPYLAVSQIIIALCAKDYTMRIIVTMAVIALAGYLMQLGFSTLSTIRSHRAAFTVLKNIRMQLTAKLARVPMGVALYRQPCNGGFHRQRNCKAFGDR